MIIEFSITNFGSIRNTQTLSMLAGNDDKLEEYYVLNIGGIRLLKLALLFGPNASGKTNIINALNCLRNLVLRPKYNKSDLLDVTPFQFDKETSDAPTTFRLLFFQNDVRYEYTVELTNRFVVKEQLTYYPHGRPALLYNRVTNPDTQTASLRLGSKSNLGKKGLAVLEGNTLWNNTVLGAFGKSNVDWPAVFDVHKWFRETLQEMITPKTDMIDFANKLIETDPTYKDLIVKFLEKADMQLRNVQILHEEEEVGEGRLLVGMHKIPVRNTTLRKTYLYFTHEIQDHQGVVSLHDLPWPLESNGTQRYYGLSAIMALLIRTAKINPIDELENSLHPDLMKHFLLLFLANTQKSQLLVVTHNLQMLEEENIIRHDALWFTQKRPDGSTELFSVADFDSATLRKNASVSNAYKIGKLGAKPNPGSIFMPQTN